MSIFKVVKGKWKRFNGCNDPCDMYWGPCACGAWHKAEEASGWGNMSMKEFMASAERFKVKGLYVPSEVE